MRPIITLTTDFGTADAFVGAMKGVILGICPEADLVDICHDVPPQDVRAGALRLAAAARYFPAGAVHLVVVDPGVGSSRRPIAVENDTHRFVGPDNGLMALALDEAGGRWRGVELTERRFQLPVISQTFHGRDLFAPAAAHLAAGVPLSELGQPLDHIVELTIPEPRWAGNCLRGEVIDVDRFGNLVTNVRAEHLTGYRIHELHAGNAKVGGLSQFYDPGQRLVAIISSEARLEFAAPGQSARQLLGIGLGATIEVCCEDNPSPS
jgi:S-adenosylmethionine hydrolase